VPWCKNDTVMASRSHRIGPKVRRKSTPRMKSKPPKSMPAQVTEKTAPPMTMGMSRAMLAHSSRSPLATVTRSCSPPEVAKPKRCIVSPRRKLSVEPVSSRARKRSPLSSIGTTMELVVRMPARAYSETTRALAMVAASSTAVGFAIS
jgi:hypothetical protein